MQFAPWSLQLCGVGEAVPGSGAKLCKVLCVSQNLLIINAVSLCGQKSSKTCFLPHYSALNSGQHYLHERRFDRVRSVERALREEAPLLWYGTFTEAECSSHLCLVCFQSLSKQV